MAKRFSGFTVIVDFLILPFCCVASLRWRSTRAYNGSEWMAFEETQQIIQQRLVPLVFPKHLVKLARLCLATTYFIWNRDSYEQEEGAARGSSLSPAIANIFMEAFEE